MTRKYIVLVIFLSVFFLVGTISMPSYAQSSRSCEDCYYEGYDDGYDDGYYDAWEDCPCPYGSLVANWPGLYAGLALGYSSFLLNRHLYLDDEPLARLRTYADGVLATVLAGYAWYYLNYYLALEAFFSFTGASGSSSFNTFGNFSTSDVSVRNSFGVSILPGYRLFQTLLFLRLGYINTQFRISDQTPGFINNSTDRRVSGFNYGIGMETPILKQVGVRLELNHSSYSSFTTNGNKTTPHDNQATASVIYHLGF